MRVGQAFARIGEIDRAQIELVSVTQSASAPPALRSDAYATALRYVADGGDWERAGVLFREWSTRAASDGAITDGRISAWQVRIYHHGAYPDSA